MNSINILIVGGAGYIGSIFADYINNLKKYKIVILDNLSTGNSSSVIPGAKFYKVDMLNTKKVIKIMQKESINFVVVFAAKIIVGESVFEPLDYFTNNVGGVTSVLTAMRYANIKNIIFSSTAAVYGEPKQIPVKEEDAKEPINPYGTSKLACENLIQACGIAYKMNYGILRYFNVVGASDNQLYGSRKKNPSLLIPVISKSVIENNEITVFGDDYKTKDGTCIRDYIHVVDLVRAHHLLMEKMFNNKDIEKNNYVLNLGSGTGFSVLEIIENFKKTINVDVKYKIGTKRLGDPTILITSNDRAKKEINWQPEKKLKDMIESEYNFYKKIC